MILGICHWRVSTTLARLSPPCRLLLQIIVLLSVRSCRPMIASFATANASLSCVLRLRPRPILLLLSRNLLLLLYLLLQLLFLLRADERGPLGTGWGRELDTGSPLSDHFLSRALAFSWTKEKRADVVMSTNVSRSKEKFLPIALRVLTYGTCKLPLLIPCIIRDAVS